MQFRKIFQQFGLRRDEPPHSPTDLSASEVSVELQGALERVLNLQPEFDAKNTPAMRERGVLVRNDITALLRRILGTLPQPNSPGQLEVQGSDGVGSRSRIPWTRIYSPIHSPRPTTGWYLVYLFSYDGSTVFLSLNQGTTNPIVTGNQNHKLRKKPDAEISGNVRRAREFLYPDLIYPDNLATDIQLDLGYHGLGSAYELGNVFAIRYERGRIPAEDRLARDLAAMLDLLDQLYGLETKTVHMVSEKPAQPKIPRAPQQVKPFLSRGNRMMTIPGRTGTSSVDISLSERALGLQGALERVLNLQPEFDAKNTPAMRERGVLVRNDITALLRRILGTLPHPNSPGQLEVQGKDGQGNKTRIPWTRIYSPIYSPRPTIGWYLVYLFSYDGSSVYLSLNQGTQDWKYGYLVQKPSQEIRGRANWARQFLASDNLHVHDLVTDIQLVLEDRTLGSAYELGNVFAIRYERESVPTENQLARDLAAMLDLLDQLYRFEAKAVPRVSQMSTQPRIPGPSTSRREWTEAEMVVLCAIFSVSRFSAGDDEKEECKRIAKEFGRSPGTIDRQWRNIKDYLAGLPTQKVGAKVKYWAQTTLEEPILVMSLAKYYCSEYEWQLEGLLRY